MIPILDTLTAFFKSITSVTDEVKQREALKNAADKQAAAEAVKDQAVVDRIRKHVAEEDLDEIRKDIAAPDSAGARP